MARRKALLPVLVLALLAFSIVEFAHGQTSEWTGAGDGSSWSDPNNWSPVGVPGAASNAIFNGTYTIRIDSAAIAQQLSATADSNVTLVGSGALELENGASFDHGSFTVSNTNVDASASTIRVESTASLQVSNGGQVSGNQAIFGTLAPVTVSGSGSQWNTKSLTGSVNVFEGGEFRVANVARLDGTTTVHGEGSLFESDVLLVGNSNDLPFGVPIPDAFLVVEDGASVRARWTSVGLFPFGSYNDPRPTAGVIVSGPGSTLDTSILRVGIRGTDYTGFSVEVNDGGQIRGEHANIGVGRYLGGTATVSGAGSLFEFETLIVGHEDSGRLNVLDGGQAKTQTTRMGIEVGLATQGLGQATVRGNGSRWDNALDLDMGLTGGNAYLRISDGGLVNVGGKLTLGLGGIRVNSGGLLRAGELFMANGLGDELILGGGTVEAIETIFNRGSISGDGTIRTGTGFTNHGVVEFDDTTDIHGAMINHGDLSIARDTTLNFHDRLENYGEINAGDDSMILIFDLLVGEGGSFTGNGTVVVEGEIETDESLAEIEFEGDLLLGADASTTIELGGSEESEYDRFLIGGDLHLDGALTVSLVNGIDLRAHNRFVIAEVAGNVFGEFSNVAEGGLVGSYFDTDLFLTYAGGDGNDIVLFAVPEPGTATILTFVAIVGLGFRRRQSSSQG